MAIESKRKRRYLMPPVVLLAAAFTCSVLRHWLPIVEFGSKTGWVVGIVLIVVGFGIVLSCAMKFRRRGTTIVPFQESESLIKDGLFRFSRNPIYLGMVVALCGFAMTLGSLSPWIMPPLFVLIITKRFIVKEEVMLTETFGEEYLEYCKRVRRWL